MTDDSFNEYQAGALYNDLLADLTAGGHWVEKLELHKSKAFNGHIDK